MKGSLTWYCVPCAEDILGFTPFEHARRAHAAMVRCDCCEFFDGDPKSSSLSGFCLRFPQSVRKAKIAWCGEFRAKET
ncbi:MAG: hypothetical protein ACREMY_04685 [bacterium]